MSEEKNHERKTDNRKAGVIGWPVQHSLSPRLHGFWLKKFGLTGTYEAVAVEPTKLREGVETLRENGFAGFNVTVPHKETIIEYLDDVTPDAKRIGAVNTVIIDPDGKMYGSNTDTFGFMENLKNGAPDLSVKTGPAVVLGAGGAARAVVVSLLDAGAPSVRLINRTRARAEKLASEMNGKVNVIDWSARTRALDGAVLLVNTTSLGMQGKPALDLSLEYLPLTACVNDIVYTPLQTNLLRSAAEKGNTTVDGLGMLLHQARPGFAAWFGIEPDISEALRAHVLEGLKG